MATESNWQSKAIVPLAINAMNIDIPGTADAAVKRVAVIITVEAILGWQNAARFAMTVSGGHTRWLMLRALATADVLWPALLDVVQVDDRVAPPKHPDRHLTHLHEILLDHAPLADDQIHKMPVEAVDSEDAAAEYVPMLARIAGSPCVLDLAHLGLGPDGHTGSLVFGDPALDVYQRRCRMTLTYPTINRSRCIVRVVSGSEKASMLTRLLAGNRSSPAGRVLRKRALVIAHHAAAEKLTRD